MSNILLRDDDANATTDTRRLARAYAPLLDAGTALSLSVIPAARLDVRAPDGVRERFLDASWPESSRCAVLGRGAPLARFVAEHPNVDVLQHGFTHERVAEGTEFGALGYEDALLRIDRGDEILRGVFGRSACGFVAPWDWLSAGSVRATTERFPFVSTSWVQWRTLPLDAWPAHAWERRQRREVLRVGSAWVARHRGGLLGPTTEPADVAGIVDRLSRGAALGVIVLHHWMFWEQDEPHPVIRALARALRGHDVVRARDVGALLGHAPSPLAAAFAAR